MTKAYQEAKINFCQSKCNMNTCDIMKGKDGYPCIEFICQFCLATTSMTAEEKQHYCNFCKGK